MIVVTCSLHFLQLFKNVKSILSSQVLQKQADVACGLWFAAPGLVSVKVGGWVGEWELEIDREGPEPQFAACLVVCLRTTSLTSLGLSAS